MDPARYQLMLEITPQSAGNVVITPEREDYEENAIVMLTAQAGELKYPQN